MIQGLESQLLGCRTLEDVLARYQIICLIQFGHALLQGVFCTFSSTCS
jgi:hypothetical protein